MIPYDEECSLNIRIIGKVNVVVSVYINDDFIAQVNMRKNRGRWRYKVKKLNTEKYVCNKKGYHYVHDEDKLKIIVEKHLLDYQIDKVLLT